MGIIIDTSALVEIERGSCEFPQVLDRFKSESVAIPAIVWAELLSGVRLAKNAQIAAQRRAQLEQLSVSVPIIEFDSKTAEFYADIFSECLMSGKMIPQNDISVAATARNFNFKVLVSRNGEKHFRQIKDLEVITLP